MATNGAPEQWDQDETALKMAALNVGAPSFVPNANAAAFVPSWLNSEPAAAPGLDVLQLHGLRRRF
jgi:hypothetical protein